MQPHLFQHRYVTVNGASYHYVDEGCNGPVVLLLHGFPDFWYGWRHQIHFLSRQGYRVIAPDLRGYGETSGIDSIADVRFSRVANDLMTLLTRLGIDRVVVIGHDWGGALAWRVYLYFPQRVIAVGSICTAYTPPAPKFYPLEEIVRMAPHMKYQLYLASEQAVVDMDAEPELFFHMVLRKWNQPLMLPETSEWRFTSSRPSPTELLTPDELNYYVKTFSKSGFSGPLAWYRTRRLNYEDEQGLSPHIHAPALMILAKHDTALPPSMSQKMGRFFDDLTTVVIEDAGHWVMVEQTEQVNRALLAFLNRIVPVGSHAKL